MGPGSKGKGEMEGGSLREGAEVAVAGDEGDAGVEAGLSDQGVGQASAESFCEDF